MTSSGVRWITAIVAGVGCCLLGSIPTGAVAAPSAPSAASAAAHPAGFFVTGQGRVAVTNNQAALVRDTHGGQHVLTSIRSSTVAGDKGHILYVTRLPGKTHWLTHEIPGLRPLAGLKIEEHLSYSGSRVFAVLYECDGVFVTDASRIATRLPEPSLVQAANNCSSPGSSPAASAPPTADAVDLPGTAEIGVLLPDPAQANRPAIFSGTPGGTFTPGTAIPDTDGFTPLQMTIDEWNGRITVIGEGTDGTSKGIYDVSMYYYGSAWSNPVKIASLASPTSDYTVESVVAFKSAIWVGLLRPHGPTTHPTHVLYLVHGNSNGQWFGAVPLTHTTGQDTALSLVINQSTDHLHAAFTRVDPAAPAKKSGIMVQARFNGKWQAPKFLTHWYHDYTDQITLTSKGTAVIGYAQR